MSDRGTEILKEALSLSPGERADVAERLLSSLDAPDRERVDELWASEAEDRLDAYEQGKIETVPANRKREFVSGASEMAVNIFSRPL